MKRQRIKRVVSALLAFTLTSTGLFSYLPSYAEEEVDPGIETAAESSQEDGTEEAAAEEFDGTQKYKLTLLYNEGLGFTYDEEKYDHQDEESKEIVLFYEPDEQVEISLMPDEGQEISELRLVDQDKVDYDFTWEEADRKMTFPMPDRDVWVYTALQDCDGDESGIDETVNAVKDDNAGIDNVSDSLAAEDSTDENNTDQVSLDATDDSVYEDNAQAVEAALNTEPELDEDGLPVQGSVITVEAISIPFDTWDFDPQTDFTNIDYEPEQFSISYVSDDIVYDTIGTYSSIYRVTDNDSEKFWFVLRPVIVTDEIPETESKADEPEMATQAVVNFMVGDGGVIMYEKNGESIALGSEDMNEDGIFSDEIPVGEEIALTANSYEGYLLDCVTVLDEYGDIIGLFTGTDAETGVEFSVEATEEETLTVAASFKYLDLQVESESEEEPQEESETEVKAESDDHTVTFRTEGPGIMNVYTENDGYSLISSDDPYETVLDLDEIDQDVFYVGAVTEGTGEYIGYSSDDGIGVTVMNYESGLGGYAQMEIDLSEARGGEVLTLSFDEYVDNGIQKMYITNYDFDKTTKHTYSPSEYIYQTSTCTWAMYDASGNGTPLYGDCAGSTWGNGGWYMTRPSLEWLYQNLGINGSDVPDKATFSSLGMKDGYVMMRCNGTSHASQYGWGDLSDGQAYVRCCDIDSVGEGSNEKVVYTFVAWYRDYSSTEGQTTEGYFQLTSPSSGEAKVRFQKKVYKGEVVPKFKKSDAEDGNETIDQALANAENGRDIFGNRSSLMNGIDNSDDDDIDDLDIDVRAGTEIRVFRVNSAGMKWILERYPDIYDETNENKANSYKDLTNAVYELVQDVFAQGVNKLGSDSEDRFTRIDTVTVPNNSNGKTDYVYITPEGSEKDGYADIYVYQETSTSNALNNGWYGYRKNPDGFGFSGGIFFAAKQSKSDTEYSIYYRTMQDVDGLGSITLADGSNNLRVPMENELVIYSAPIEKVLEDQTGKEFVPADLGLTWKDFSWQISTTSDFTSDTTISVPFSTGNPNKATNVTNIYGLFPGQAYYVREDPNCTAVKSGMVEYCDTYISFWINEDGNILYSDKYITDVTSKKGGIAATKHDTIGISDSGEYQLVNVVSSGYAYLVKSTANTEVVNGNSMYSLEGAQYTVYDSDGKTAATLTTKSDGTTDPVLLKIGNYTVKETKAPKGYKLDAATYSVEVKPTNTIDNPAEVKASDIPVTYVPDVFLVKDTEYNTSMSLEDARFEVNFYAGASNDSGTPTRTWVLKSVEADNEYVVRLDKTCFVSGNDLYTDENGDYCLPLGFCTIKEIDPPEGYQLSNDEISYAITQNGDEAKADITVNGYETDGSPVVRHEAVINDNPIWGGIEIDKRDIETEDGQPQGDATLEGGIYSIINMNSYTVSLKDNPEASFGPGEEVMQLVTDEDGHAESGVVLQYGSYKVVEVQPPLGYTSDGENTVFDVTIKNQDEVLGFTVKNRVIRFDIQLIKFRDTLSSEEPTDDVEPIEGVVFGIYLKRTDELILTITTDEEGVATTADPENYPYGRLPYGTYVIRELEYPEDVMPVEDFEVFGEIDGKTYAGIYKNDRPIESGITVVKTDAESGKIIPLAGTEFQILDADGEVLTFNNYYPHYEELTNFITDESGSVTLPQKLAYGTYYLHEVNAPYGYLLADDIEFEITEYNSWPATVTVELPDYPEKGRIVVNKYDAETKEALAGAVFAVFADENITTPDGTVHAVKDQYIEGFTIDEDGVGMSSELYLGKYYVQEIQAPKGYCLDDTRIEAVLEYEDELTPVTYLYLESYNNPTTVIINKTDENGEALEGIKFEITPILIAEEDEEAEEETEEESEPTTQEEMEDAAAENQTEDITDEESSPVSAEDHDGISETTELVTDENGQIFTGYLRSGIYLIQETETLEHYILDDTVRYVTVDKNGFIYESDMEGKAFDADKAKSDRVTLTWVNIYAAVEVEVSKKDITGEEELPGAELTILDENGEVIDTWVSTEEPHKVELFEGTYTLVETIAPDGYATAESVEFTIDNENTVHTVTMYDAPLVIDVSKKDITGEEELPDAHLIVEDQDGQVIDEWISTEEAHVIERIPAGTYTLTEITAPDGYEVAETIEFTVTDTAEVQHVEMFDSPTPTVEVSKKDITDNEELPGAKLTIFDENGDFVEEWISTEEAHSLLLSPGAYTLVEVTAPDGFATAEDVDFTVDDSLEVQHVEMFDTPIQIEISKKDITDDEELPGAHLIVKKKDGDTIDEWTSTSEPHIITNLTPGDYTLTEITAPDGYDIAETVEFTVEDTCEIQHVQMYDSPKEGTVDLTGKTTNTTTTTTTGTPTSTYSTPKDENMTATSVKTGDIFRYGVPILVLGCGVVLLILTTRKKKRAGQ